MVDQEHGRVFGLYKVIRYRNMIRLYRGKTKFMHLPIDDSCPVIGGSLMRWGGNGVIGPAAATGSGFTADNSTASSTLVGVVRHDILSTTDDNYTTRARLVEVEVPVENNVEWEVDFIDSVLAADVGLFVDLYDASTAIRSVSTIDHMQIVKRLSATKAVCILNAGVAGFGSVGAA